MREFDLVIEYTARKKNLLADALSRKHTFSLIRSSEQNLIPQSIDSIEDNTNPNNTSITVNNPSISPTQDNGHMVSRSCINFKNADCDFNRCAGREESLGHYLLCPYLDDENDGDQEDETEEYDNIKEEEMTSDEDTLSTIPEESFEGYEPQNYPHNIEQDQLNEYHHISIPTVYPSSSTNDDNIPSIITDIVNNAWEYYKQH
jgi:hypothetical protein